MGPHAASTARTRGNQRVSLRSARSRTYYDVERAVSLFSAACRLFPKAGVSRLSVRHDAGTQRLAVFQDVQNRVGNSATRNLGACCWLDVDREMYLDMFALAEPAHLSRQRLDGDDETERITMVGCYQLREFMTGTVNKESIPLPFLSWHSLSQGFVALYGRRARVARHLSLPPDWPASGFYRVSKLRPALLQVEHGFSLQKALVPWPRDAGFVVRKNYSEDRAWLQVTGISNLPPFSLKMLMRVYG